MRLALLAILLAVSANAQTTVYARASGPAGGSVSSVATGTPPVVTSATAHGLSVGNIVGIWGSCSGNFLDPNSARSPYNGIFLVASTPSVTTFALNDLTNTAVVGNGNSVSCAALSTTTGASAYWGKLTAFTLGTPPIGWLDGLNGAVNRKLALTTLNGLTSLVVNSSHIATATTSYNHGIANGDKLSVWNSLNSTLNNGNSNSTAYVAQNVTSTTFDFPVNASIPSATYTNANNACGPAPTPNDTIGGTQDCLVISQLMFAGNSFWDGTSGLKAFTDYTVGGTQPNAYKSPFDGGNIFSTTTDYLWGLYYGLAAVRFQVDRTNTTLASVLAYAWNNIDRAPGANWMCQTDLTACGLGTFEGNGDAFIAGVSEMAMFLPFMSSAHVTTAGNKIYNDTDQYGVTPASTTHADMGEDKVNRVVTSGGTGTVQAGTSTSFTLDSGGSGTNSFYVGNIVDFHYETTITAITVLSSSTVQIDTASDYGSSISFIYPKLSGITGTGTCSQMNVKWQATNGLTVISSTRFVLNFPAAGGCTSPTGGTVVSYPVCQTGAIGPCYGVITAYDGTTKVATVAGGFNSVTGQAGSTHAGSTTPAAGQHYKIYQTITASTLTQHQTGVTVTGVNTHFTTDVAVGDGIFATNGLSATEGFYGLCLLYVTGVTDDTHITVTNNSPLVEGSLSTTVPALLWIVKAWAPGDAGFTWLNKYWQGTPGAQPVMYPIAGGDLVGVASGIGQGSNNGIQNSWARFTLGMQFAPSDSRAVLDAARNQTYGFDYELAHYMDNLTGFAHSGATYSNGVIYGMGWLLQSLSYNLPGYPSVDPVWLTQTSLQKIFSILPDLNSATSSLLATPMGFGTETGDAQLRGDGGNPAEGFVFDPIFWLAPTSGNAKYLRYFEEHVTSVDMYSDTTAKVNYFQGKGLLDNDPRAGLPSTDYFSLPLQYAFLKSSSTACASLTGWTCPPTFAGHAFLSRTGWTDRTATLTFFGARSWYGDHDRPMNATFSLFKVGGLIAGDSPFNLYGSSGLDFTTQGDLPRIGGISNNVAPGAAASPVNGQPQWGLSPMTQWANSNHGSFDPQFGDQNSKVVLGCADTTQAYIAGILTSGRRCIADLKDSTLNTNTGEQVIFDWQEIVVPSPTQIEGHVHYLNNGQLPYATPGIGYSEGDTTCPGSGGCPNLNTNRTIQSLEDGSGPDAGSDNPQRNYGVISKFFSPGTITLRDDAPAVTVSSVVKSSTTVAIASLTPGNPTVIQTSSSHSVVLNEHISVTGVSGTGTCNGGGAAGAAVLAVPDTTHLTLQYDSSTCSGPSGGTLSTPTVFNAPSAPIYSACAISSITIGFPPTVTCTTAHNLVVGQAVQLIGVTSAGGTCDASLTTQWGLINTAAVVLTTPTTTTFTVNVSTGGCGSLSGGIAFGGLLHTITIRGATGNWAAINTDTQSLGFTTDSQPKFVWPIDANTFSLYPFLPNGDPVPSTSAFSGTFDGNVGGEYYQGLGWSHRVSLCGGAACGTNVSNLRVLSVHKIAQNLSDTSLTATSITPDANWFGAQTKDKVALFAIGGLQSAITSFTTTHSGTAQYLISGLAPGSYAITIGGTPVTGSPFAVTSAQDAHVDFESTAGAVTVSGTPTSCAISTSSLPGGSVGTAYSQSLGTSGCTGSVAWTYVTGALCHGLQLSSAGVVSGTPDATCTAPITFAATDSAGAPITVNKALTLSMTNGPTITASPSSLTYSCTAGGSAGSQNVAIGASGVTLDNWSATKGQSWLTLTPTSNTVASTMAASVSCAALSAGNYSDTIAIASTTSGITNSPLNVSVSLTVNAPPPSTGTLLPGASVRGAIVH